jgi:hypothetical protein
MEVDMNTRFVSNMERKCSVPVLNELLAELDCSLARYLSYARPRVPPPNMLLESLVRRLSYEHEMFASSIARLIYDRRGTVNSCAFPMDFTSYNDLSLEYLAPRLLEHERALIATAEECAERLHDDPEARRVVRKIVVSLRRYAALLAELLAPIRVAPPPVGEDAVTSGRYKAPSWNATARIDQLAAEPQTAV